MARRNAIWEEMIADPTSCFGTILYAYFHHIVLMYINSHKTRYAEEQKTFQIQHGEKYIQLKAYTDQLEAELRETKTKMDAVSTTNEELRECKALKSQTSLKQYPSPAGSASSATAVTALTANPGLAPPPQFSRSISRPVMRTAPQSAHHTVAISRPKMHISRPETPGMLRRPGGTVFERMQRPDFASAADGNKPNSTCQTEDTGDDLAATAFTPSTRAASSTTIRIFRLQADTSFMNP
ncbi:TPA: hypothetical protein N0F65_012271 [Lagenidium giganteum]|uniref:Uncharacterized protein n=1 Tax=Lagenidium giganteum TaxID=4803 RepID=A0AAV2ZCD6_9STRA|nr:TPA: hypothetical protein N0F65_012271 [Lagenidium giganteum]